MGYAVFHYEINEKKYQTEIFETSEGTSMHTYDEMRTCVSSVAPGPELGDIMDMIKATVKEDLAAQTQ